MKRGIFLFFLVLCTTVKSQINPANSFREIILKTDTLTFSSLKDNITFKNTSYLGFYFGKQDEVCEINLYPSDSAGIKSVKLVKSADFEQLDSLLYLNNQYYRTKVKFINLNKSEFVSFIFELTLQDSSKKVFREIKLFPYTRTTVNFYPSSDELFIGEEKIFELLTNNINNIKITNEWSKGQDINYRISELNGQLRVHVVANVLGSRDVNLRIQTKTPFINDKKELIYDLPVITRQFKVKASRQAFLNMDKQEVTFDETSRKEGIELQMDNNRQLILGKTYRIEDQEQPGGALIAEIFTKSYLANDRILCILRPFNFHRKTEGYLYMKDGDDVKFITNLNITPKTTINSIQVMHEGQDWTSSTNVYPGETVNVKLEGEGFQKAKFHWEDVLDITSDTLVRNENTCYFRLKVPLSINKRKVALFNNSTNTGMGLNVTEYQVPRKLDFITLNYGNGTKTLSTMSPTVIQRNTIKDLSIGFNNSKIDEENKLYGKQYLDIDVRLTGKSGELIEMRSIKNLVVCPEGNTPRAAYYKDKTAVNSNLDLNTYLSNKTYNLDDFSKIQLEIKQQTDKYSEPAYTKQVEIVLQRKFIFDTDVSFPAGLMIQNLGRTGAEKDKFRQYDIDYANWQDEQQIFEDKYNAWDPNSGTAQPTAPVKPVKPTKAVFTDNLGGVSLALIMQFSFPDGEKVGKSKPYRLGAGFLAINAFNFNQSAQRDLAAVVLTSFYPIKPGRLFSLPIHFGFGYKFQDKIPFMMLSPGIGIRF